MSREGKKRVAAESKPGRRLPRMERESQLLTVAEAVFAERGFSGVTMDELAEAAGVTKPVLYQHFSSKDALVAAIIARARDELFALSVEALTEATSDEHALWLTQRAFFAFVRDHDRAWALLDEDGALSGTAAAAEFDVMRDQQAEFASTLLGSILADLDEMQIAVLAQAVGGASERVARWLRANPHADLDEVTDYLVESVLLGIRTLRAGQRWTREW